MRLRRIAVGLTAALALLVPFTAASSANAATQTALSATAPASHHLVNPKTASTTKSCSTGGYSYTTDSMYVVRTYLGSSQWKYTITRSKNRTVTVNISGTYHYVQHTAVALNQYTAGTVKKVTNPGNTTYMYSRSGADDFGMWFDVTDHATMNLHKGCYVYF